MADPDYDNPSFSIFNTTTYGQSPSLTLALLLEAWPVNSYPYAVQLPSGSVFVAAGTQSVTFFSVRFDQSSPAAMQYNNQGQWLLQQVCKSSHECSSHQALALPTPVIVRRLVNFELPEPFFNSF